VPESQPRRSGHEAPVVREADVHRDAVAPPHHVRGTPIVPGPGSRIPTDLELGRIAADELRPDLAQKGARGPARVRAGVPESRARLDGPRPCDRVDLIRVGRDAQGELAVPPRHRAQGRRDDDGAVTEAGREAELDEGFVGGLLRREQRPEVELRPDARFLLGRADARDEALVVVVVRDGGVTEVDDVVANQTDLSDAVYSEKESALRSRRRYSRSPIMASVGVVFPGQGSQRVGMARDFYDAFASSREVYAEASEALGLDVAALCFEENDRLDLTEYTQPAILVAEMAMLRPLRDEMGLAPNAFGGHSLGEYAALCAAGAIPLAVCVKLVRKRGALMQEAVPPGQGAMTAVTGESVAKLDVRAALDELGVDLANLNSPNQIVLSGPATAMEAACARVRAAAGDRSLDFTPLTVSAPFHSRAMRAIEPPFRAALDAVVGGLKGPPAAQVTSNFRGDFHTGQTSDLLDALERQIGGTVDWVANMRALVPRAETLFEIGPGRPLRGFFKAIGVEVSSITSLKAAERALQA
jgi:[acyl-carrier-protein] S-malonyltransferase